MESTSLANEYAAATQSAALFNCDDAAKIELAGPEARMFLHNLCSQDVKNLPEGGGGEAFLTTAKARVVAHGVVNHVRWQGQPVLWFDTSPGQGERVLSHLNHFLISEQVELADRTSELAMLRLVGPASAAMLAKVLGVDLSRLTPWQHLVHPWEGSEVVVRRHASLGLPAYDCLSLPNLASTLRERLLAAGAVAASPQTYELLRVEAGWPIYGIDMDENRFVVEVGRTAHAICYTKGCYLGQEPIVMARDRGQVNRMMMGLLCGEGGELPMGTKVFAGEADVGQVTSSVISPRLGQAIALAYLRRGHQEPGMRLMTDSAATGREVVVCTLPFGVG